MNSIYEKAQGMHLHDISYRVRWCADSMLELAHKMVSNYTNIQRYFGTGVISGGQPHLKYSDYTSDVQVTKYYLKPNGQGVSHYNVTDGTVSLFVFPGPTKYNTDNSILDELTAVLDTTTKVDVQIPTRTIGFTTPILGFIGHHPVTYDATNEYIVKYFTDGTIWISLDKDRNFYETRRELDSTQYILLWAAKLNRHHHEGWKKKLSAVRDMRVLIPNSLGKWKTENRWKNSIDAPNNLPLAGNRVGDIRTTVDSYKNVLWIWDEELNTDDLSVGNWWNFVNLEKSTRVPKSFMHYSFQAPSGGLIHMATADTSTSQFIFVEGDHIDLSADADTDTITVGLEINKNLDVHMNRIYHIKDIETTKMEIYGDLLIDGTARVITRLVDIKDVLRIYKSLDLLGNLKTGYLDMTSSQMIIKGDWLKVGNRLQLEGNLTAGNINVIARGQWPPGWGEINGVDITDHHARHESGGVDEIDMTDLKGVAEGQNADELQDQTISHTTPIKGDLLQWYDKAWSPRARDIASLTLIDHIALWNERKVPYARDKDNGEFLKRATRFTRVGQFSALDDIETPQGNWVPMAASWETMEQKEMYARWIQRYEYENYGDAFKGTCYDGRYIYYAPYGSRYFVRQDTKYALDQTSTFEQMEVESVNRDMTTGGWFGCVFDGRHVFYIPSYNNHVVRYKLGHPFDDSTSWETYSIGDLLYESVEDVSYEGGVFDGNYIYLVPNTSQTALRYDVSMPLDDEGAWQSASIFGVAKAGGFRGGTWDGQYVYFSPYTHNDFIRFLPENYGSAENLEIMDVTSVVEYECGQIKYPFTYKFSGACFDGGHVYYAPQDATYFVRVNVASTFDRLDSWEVVKLSNALGNAGTWHPEWDMGASKRWSACRFDGRYIYYAPENSPMVVQYDTNESFTSPYSWDKISFSIGNGEIYKHYYSSMIHKYVEPNNRQVKGTNRLVLSGITQSGGRFEHGIWDQENPRRFGTYDGGTDLYTINKGNSADSTFLRNSTIDIAAIDRSGTFFWVFTSVHTGTHYKCLVYKIDLNGHVVGKGKKVGVGYASSWAFTHPDVDQVYGYVYFNVHTAGYLPQGFYRLRYSTDDYAYMPPHMDATVVPSLRAVRVGTYQGEPGGDTGHHGRCFKRWVNGRWESGFFVFRGSLSEGGEWNSLFNWMVIEPDGKWTFKKGNIALRAYPYYSGLGLHYGDIDIDQNGIIYCMPTGLYDTNSGSFYAFDSTNFKMGHRSGGYYRPKMIKFSGYANANDSGHTITVNPNGGLKKLNWWFGWASKLVIVLDKDENWIYVNLWDTPYRQGRISTAFNACETHPGYFHISRFGGCEIDSKYITFPPSEGSTGIRFLKSFPIDVKGKLGCRGSP